MTLFVFSLTVNAAPNHQIVESAEAIEAIKQAMESADSRFAEYYSFDSFQTKRLNPEDEIVLEDELNYDFIEVAQDILSDFTVEEYEAFKKLSESNVFAKHFFDISTGEFSIEELETSNIIEGEFYAFNDEVENSNTKKTAASKSESVRIGRL